MKAEESHPPVSPFNTPEVMKARALFVLQFFSLIACLGFAEAAIAEQAWRLMVPSMLCFALMVSIRYVLKRSGQWEVCVDGLNHAYTRTDPLPNREAESVRFVVLIDQRTEIESRRGTADFDPWALQQVRHEIIEMVKEFPELAALDES